MPDTHRAAHIPSNATGEELLGIIVDYYRQKEALRHDLSMLAEQFNALVAENHALLAKLKEHGIELDSGEEEEE